MSTATIQSPPKMKPAGDMLLPGNSKLGRKFHQFSIPAGPTCPGATAACLSVCYAKAGRYHSGSVKGRLAANYLRTRSSSFARNMTAEIKERGLGLVRIHVAGDFYDAAYTRAWLAVARACPGTTFLAYTRSWAIPEILPALEEMAGLDNFHLWFSADRDTGVPPEVPGVRVAFLVIDEADVALIPERAALVFRDKAGYPAKTLEGVQVCPYEDGIARKVGKITCTKCGICWSRKPVRVNKGAPV